MKRGWHWFMCSKCGDKYWRGHNAKFCYGGPLWNSSNAVAHAALVHMEKTCEMLGVCGSDTRYHVDPKSEAYARKMGYIK